MLFGTIETRRNLDSRGGSFTSFPCPFVSSGGQVSPDPHFFAMMRREVPVRILLICPVPIEFTSCRSLLSLRDAGTVAGCRRARGSVAGPRDGGRSVGAGQAPRGRGRGGSNPGRERGPGRRHRDVRRAGRGARGRCRDRRPLVRGVRHLGFGAASADHPRDAPALGPGAPAAAAGRQPGTCRHRGRPGDRPARARGAQACGEFFIQSPAVRDPLAALTGRSPPTGRLLGYSWQPSARASRL